MFSLTWFIIWLFIAAAAAVGEMLTAGLFLATVAVAAGLTAVTSIALPPLMQVVIFAMFSVVGLAVFRPILVQMIGYNELTDFIPVPHSRLIGRRAVVVNQVSAAGGQIRVGEGEFWSARPYDPDQTIQPGIPVDVLLVDGLTALVSPAVPLLEADTAQAKGI